MLLLCILCFRKLCDVESVCVCVCGEIVVPI